MALLLLFDAPAREAARSWAGKSKQATLMAARGTHRPRLKP